MTTASQRVSAASSAPPRLGYRPELDGVRAIAVLAVLGFHLAFMAHWLGHLAQGGFLGVDVFFVLSGMLITELIVSDAAGRHPRTTLRGFYQRRSLRLIPALVLMLGIVIAFYQATRGTGHETVRRLWAVVTYVTAGHLPASVAHLPDPFPAGVGHVWTLVVEWEFYLVWPFVLVALLGRNISRRTIGILVVLAAVIVTLIRAALFHHDGGNWILSYRLAWLRFDELLLGCGVGLLGDSLRVPNWLRWLGLGGVLAAISRAQYPDHWLYYGGMFALAIGTAAVVAPRTSGAWWADRILASRPMVWIGRLSYSLYLWSVPTVAEVGRRGGSIPLPLRVIVATAASFALAAASYYLVEKRFRLPSRRALDQPLRGHQHETIGEA
jgi:peptidoglycan/LPS O-acetylase OafA/YrhL